MKRAALYARTSLGADRENPQTQLLAVRAWAERASASINAPACPTRTGLLNRTCSTLSDNDAVRERLWIGDESLPI